jgi:hypothetical protein
VVLEIHQVVVQAVAVQVQLVVHQQVLQAQVQVVQD